MKMFNELCVALGLLCLFSVLGMDLGRDQSVATAAIFLAVGCALIVIGRDALTATESSVGEIELEV